MDNTTTSNVSNMAAEKKVMTLCLSILGFVALLGNCVILACIPCIRRRQMNANLRWSLSLAGADAWAALLFTTGIVWNSYLPMVVKFPINAISCFNLALEVFRLCGIITSVLHLLALSLNHYAGIINPFKHKRIMTTRRCKIISAILWTAPLAAMFVCFNVFSDDGFRNTYCSTDFYFTISFRVPIFVVFYLPMATMLVVYGRILYILRAARKDPDLEIATESSGSPKASPRSTSPIPQTEKRLVMRKVSKSTATLKSRMKAVTTTLLIVGTFGLGYMPAVVFFVLQCYNCMFTRFDLSQRTSTYIGAAVNSLIILKLLMNPLIYGYRIAEIRQALLSFGVRNSFRRSTQSHISNTVNKHNAHYTGTLLKK